MCLSEWECSLVQEFLEGRAVDSVLNLLLGESTSKYLRAENICIWPCIWRKWF